MTELHTNHHMLTRRLFFSRAGFGLGAIALASLLEPRLLADDSSGEAKSSGPEQKGEPGGLPDFPNFTARAKRVIYLFQSGAPSQMDLFDYKPGLADLRGTELPDSIRRGQRLTGMTSTQTSFPVAPSKYKFAQHGESGAWISELLPHTAR